MSRSSGHGQGHRSMKAFAGGLPSIERQSCYVLFTILWQLSVPIPACLSCLVFYRIIFAVSIVILSEINNDDE